MTRASYRFVLAASVAPAVIATVLSLYRPPFLASLDDRVYDVLLRSARTAPPGGRIVIVDVDEASLSAVGQWPWRRDVIGRLVDRLRDLGSSTIALDIIFAESDRYEGSGPSTDALLAETLRKGRVVLGYAMTFGGAPAASNACVEHPLGLAIVRPDDEHAEDPFFRSSGAVCSLPILTRAADTSGFLNAAPDPDGILRRAPVLLELDGRVYPSLALSAVLAATGTKDVALRIANVNASSLLVGHSTVPLDGKSNLLLRFRGAKHTFPYVSAVDVLSGRAAADAFKDKIVFVGTTALGMREVVSTPLDTLFAGVEVQATAADNLLQQDFVYRPEYGIAVETQIVVALGLALALVVGRVGLAWGTALVAVSLAATWSGAIALLSSQGLFFSPLFPTLGLTGAIGAALAARFWIERRRADRAVVEKSTSQRLMVQSLLSLTAVRDAETGRHSRRTQEYTRVLAEQLSANPHYAAYLTPERVDLLSNLAPLHDIGKVGVPDRLLNKPGALTPEELVEMRRHPVHGRDVILNAELDVGVHDDAILALAKDIVYTHHEKWDGTGYPEGLRGESIPIAGRVIAVVDVYDAVLSRRLYQEPMTHAEAVALIVAGKATHFDPEVVDAFVCVAPILERLSTQGMPVGDGQQTAPAVPASQG
jgi:HD-GYP domain-containing protein (c-di-GMP phosphodiesterase class II)